MKAQQHKSKAGRTAGVCATILWIAGFALIFVLPPRSTFMWTSDFLLLAGFFPLLLLARVGWPWLLFGMLNIVIGFILEVAYHIPDDVLTSSGAVSVIASGGGMTPEQLTQQMLHVRDHLRDCHSPLTWMLVGFGSMVYGFVRTICDIIAWLHRRRAREKSTAD